MRLVTSQEMKACDQYTIETIGIPSMVLMERAALSVVNQLDQQNLDLSKVLIVCGTGNNGGDGLAIARLLHLKQIPVAVLLLGDLEHLTPDTKQQLHICQYYHLPLFTHLESMDTYTTIIDAIFGIGLTRKVTGLFAEAINAINLADAAVVSVDIPSGISADDGTELGIAVNATATITFAFKKIGLTIEPGMTHAGQVTVTDIGIYDDAL